MKSTTTSQRRRLGPLNGHPGGVGLPTRGKRRIAERTAARWLGSRERKNVVSGLSGDVRRLRRRQRAVLGSNTARRGGLHARNLASDALDELHGMPDLRRGARQSFDDLIRGCRLIHRMRSDLRGFHHAPADLRVACEMLPASTTLQRAEVNSRPVQNSYVILTPNHRKSDFKTDGEAD